jgi:hypothetical protein
MDGTVVRADLLDYSNCRPHERRLRPRTSLGAFWKIEHDMMILNAIAADVKEGGYPS